MIPLGVICDTERHCHTCRDRRQAAWRAALSAVYDIPGGAIDFDCPRGRPWHGVASDVEFALINVRRIELCEACDHETMIGESRACRLLTNAMGRPCASLFQAALNGASIAPEKCPWQAEKMSENRV